MEEESFTDKGKGAIKGKVYHSERRGQHLRAKKSLFPLFLWRKNTGPEVV